MTWIFREFLLFLEKLLRIFKFIAFFILLWIFFIKAFPDNPSLIYFNFNSLKLLKKINCTWLIVKLIGKIPHPPISIQLKKLKLKKSIQIIFDQQKNWHKNLLNWWTSLLILFYCEWFLNYFRDLSGVGCWTIKGFSSEDESWMFVLFAPKMFEEIKCQLHVKLLRMICFSFRIVFCNRI